MRILVCGGRDFSDYSKFEKILKYFSNITGLCHGGAKGADVMTHKYVTENFQSNNTSLEYKVFLADWEKHGKSAGFIRNKEMLDSFKPDLVVAFPGGSGTLHMINYSKSKGYSVLEVQ